MRVGEPTPPTEEQKAFLRCVAALEGTEEEDQPLVAPNWPQKGQSTLLSSVEVLAAYGLNLETLSHEVEKFATERIRKLMLMHHGGLTSRFLPLSANSEVRFAFVI